MPAVVDGIFQPNGPQVVLRIGPVVAPVAPGAAPPDTIICIIDTAAFMTAVSPAVLQTLQIPVVRQQNVHRAGYAAVQANIHRVSLWSHAGDLIAADVEVSAIHPVGTECLLGRDVLNRGVLVQDGPVGTIQVKFP